MAAEQIVSAKPIKIYWQPFTFTENQTRIFYGNAIVFNNQGTGDVTINSVFLLSVGDTLTLNCDPNEIDNTIYNINFTTGFTNKLGVFVKMNEGVNSLLEAQTINITPPMDRRKLVKKYEARRNRGGF